MNEVYLVASGDLRQSANLQCWPAQREMEAKLGRAFEAEGVRVRRAHPVDEAAGHGFLDSQRKGMDTFQAIPESAPVVVATAVWQYSHHVLPGLRHHRGRILTAANWEGTWPGLVGLLNLNGSLTKANVPYDTLWSQTFEDAPFRERLRTWIRGEPVAYDLSHVRPFAPDSAPPEAREAGQAVASEILRRKAILGVFDEGCMGMYNAIIDDEMLNPLGIFKERLSQSALYAAMREVADEDAAAVRRWLDRRGMRFETGDDPQRHLTEAQILDQCRMYVAALRIADAFGCDAIGIQYQQGLKDLAPASDLVEGLLNDADRPPVQARDGRVLYEGAPLPHFNEVDEGAGVDALVTNRVWSRFGSDPATTLHDVRYGEPYPLPGMEGEPIVWVFEISGAVPAAHLQGGYAGATGYRQPPMFFPQGGATLSGVAKPGEIVWSRVFVQDGRLHADVGRGAAVELPEEETRRRRQATTPEWPIQHAVLYGVDRDQLMARHKANHVQVAYGADAAEADRLAVAKACAFDAMGMTVHWCGTEPQR